MKRDTLRHARWRARRANSFINSLDTHYYGETAVVYLRGNSPRAISFKLTTN